MLWSTGGVVVCLVVLGLSFTSSIPALAGTSVYAMILYLLIFGVGLSPMPWTVNSEIYPLRVRSTAISFATAVNWLSNYIVAASFLTVAEALSTDSSNARDHPDGAFWLYAGLTSIGWMWLYLNMPETKGLALEEIEALFSPVKGSKDKQLNS